MKRLPLTIASVTAAAVFATGAIAQRHDEKPHGMTKKSETTEQTRAVGTGGRHDEGGTTHGKKKTTQKKAQEQAEKTEDGK